MATLHLLNKPPEHSRFQRCLDAVDDGDTLVLIEAAVTALALDRPWPKRTLALASDLSARGLGVAVPDDIEQIDAAGLVTLTEATAAIISW